MTTKQIDGIYLTFGAEGVKDHYAQKNSEELNKQAHKFTSISFLLILVVILICSLEVNRQREKFSQAEKINHFVLEKLAADCQKKCEQVNNAYCTGL